MKTVVTTSAVLYREVPHKAGVPFDVDDVTAQAYADRGILHTKGPTEQMLLQRQILRHTSAERMVTATEYDDSDDFPTPPPEKEFVFLPITAEQYAALQTAGYSNPDALRGASVEEIEEIPGFDRESAEGLLNSISGASEEEIEEAPPPPPRPTQTQRATRLAGTIRR